MKIKNVAVAAAVMTILVAAGCAKPPPASPDTISGEGRYDFNVLRNGEPDFVGGNEADVLLTKGAGGLYAGTVLSKNCANPGICPQGYFELRTSGKSILSLYTRDAAVEWGQGFELNTTEITMSEFSDANCASGLLIEFTGGYLIDGVPSSEFSADASIQVCDPVAAAYFA